MGKSIPKNAVLEKKLKYYPEMLKFIIFTFLYLIRV